LGQKNSEKDSKKFPKTNFGKKISKINFQEKVFRKKISTNIGWSKFKSVEVEREWNFTTTVDWSGVGVVYTHLPPRKRP